MSVKAIPQGYHSVLPYLTVEGAARLIDFLKQAFNAQEGPRRTVRPDGTIAHAEVKIGDSFVWLGDARGEWKAMPSALYVYVDDADATYKRAIEAGATSLMEPSDQIYGDRMGGVKDPAGNYWWIATHKEDVSPEEMDRREAAQRKP